jgi:protein TIF31
VSSQEQVHEIRQSIIDQPDAFRYTCFHLEHDGKRVNDFLPLSDIPGLIENPDVQLVEDPYTERDARLHFVRIRELIGAAGDRSDIAHGILPGISLLDEVSQVAQAAADGQVSPVQDHDFSSIPPLSALVPEAEQVRGKTVKSLSLSSWHPPPCHLRQKGHLLYLVVTTNEGDQYQITSHFGGFYVNKSSNAKFDPFPRPAPKNHSDHSLLTLIGSISPSFTDALADFYQQNNRRDPLATFQITHALPAAPWVVPPFTSPHYLHVPDLSRSQETYLVGGLENADTLRDWNEEFQSAREHPKESVQDRVFRERLISKLYADYVDAATRGAMLVARGEVPALNPTECADAQIFVYNNVFFSFGADGVGTFASEGGDEAARVATGKDAAGVQLVNQLDIDGLYTATTVVVDYMGKRIIAQGVVPGIFKQREPGEHQIDYGGVEGKDVITTDERFVTAFETLSKALKVKKHPVWDKDGKRFDLEGSVETKGLMGTDGRKYVLDLYRITPVDIEWLEECQPVEPATEEPEYPHRMTVLRPELVDLFARYSMKEWVNAELAKQAESKVNGKEDDTGKPEASDKEATENGDAKEPTDAEPKEQIDASQFRFALNPDVGTGQVPQTDEEKADLEADEQEVRKACRYLRDHAIPGFLRDLVESDVGFPMDGESLSRALHKRGINMRYIGNIAGRCEDPRLACLRSVCVQAMITRAFKHVASAYLRQIPFLLASACASHLLNCLLGSRLNVNPSAEVDESLRAVYSEGELAFEKVTAESLKAQVEQQVFARFRYRLPVTWMDDMKRPQMLREVSLCLGLQVQARTYVFEEPKVAPPVEAATNGHSDVHDNGEAPANGSGGKKKKKKARDNSPSSASTGSSSPPSTFSPDDVVNLVPVVKHSGPRSSLAAEAQEAGRISLLQNQKKLGQELLVESLSLHEQIYGIVHPEVARAYNALSMIWFQMDEKEVAVELAKKAVIVSERTIGIDSAETLLNYLNLSLFVHQAGDSKGALVYARHALELWKIIYGPDHPDSITTINNAAVMLQHVKAYHDSRLWFEESLRICENVFGKQSVNAATLLFQLAQALALDQEPKAAVQRMRESYNIFLAELGPTDKNTKEAETWLEQLTQNAVSIAKQDKLLASRRLRVGGSVGGRLAAQARTSSPASTASKTSASTAVADNTPKVDSRSIDELIRYIEGGESAKKPKARGNPKRRGNGAKAGAAA